DHGGVGGSVLPGDAYGFVHGAAAVEDVLERVPGLQPPRAQLSPNLALKILDQGDVGEVDDRPGDLPVGHHGGAAGGDGELGAGDREDPSGLLLPLFHDGGEEGTEVGEGVL